MILNIVNELVQTFGYVVVFCFGTLEGMGLPFPGEMTLIAASVYAGLTGKLNIIIIILVSTFAAFFGDNVGFYIGRKKGSKILNKYGRYFHINKDRIDYAEKYFHKHGTYIVFIGRFISVFRMFSPILAGINKMDYKKFAFFNFLGCLLWSLTYGVLGYFLSNNLVYLYGLLDKLTIIGITGLIVFLLISIFILKYRQIKGL